MKRLTNHDEIRSAGTATVDGLESVNFEKHESWITRFLG